MKPSPHRAGDRLARSAAVRQRRLAPGLFALLVALPAAAHPWPLERLLALPLERLLQLKITAPGAARVAKLHLAARVDEVRS